MSASLTLQYEFGRDDDFGWLETRVHTPRFSGSGGFWVQWQDVAEWSALLLAYPIPDDDPPEADWGQWDNDGNYRSIVKIRIAPANKTGDLDVIVTIADMNDEQHLCRTAFRANYPDLERFRDQIQAMMRRERPLATLTGQCGS
ncbi:hypothetical protein G4G27_00945 [Sphingomonas sp. So64.6b]|uniref:hypothetical protein n=1 Tax=Sphingomonas sp. So64.6b TaxID=2997354 RepID=UPI00160061C9|nr:hypothetical protein [Sphingomonas sp. So64.6b]QNA82732.1 hypothetical protein G4G27_00945 [Sphingomonas sp. So64.6b]